MPDPPKLPYPPYNQAPWRSRGYLPHFDLPGQLQSITIRLADSLPRETLLELAAELPAHLTQERRQHVEQLLDRGSGSCWLRDPRIAGIVESALLFFDGTRYRLLAWVIMPNHVHFLIETNEEHSLADVVKSIKAYTARQANQIIGRQGPFWHREYFDRAVRDEKHLINLVEYIHANPVKARLAASAEQWRWSSAWGDRIGTLPL